MKSKLKKAGITNIILLGLVSCFADVSSEMVYPIIPLYLTAALGATPALVGVIEGIAESLASLLKVFGGYISDKFQKKKLIAFSGYFTGILYKLALIFAGSWTGILIARLIDRFGKGIRTAPRDVMVAESADKSSLGKAFGIHKMLDMAGSAVGILFAFILLTVAGEKSYKTVFVLSIIPISIALFFFLFIKENKTTVIKKREPFLLKLKCLDKRLKLYLLVTFLFTLGNSSNSFLLLKAYDVGFSARNAILLYFVYNVTASLLSISLGKLSDSGKVGRKKLLTLGYVVFSVVYLGFAVCTNKLGMIFIFIAYGVYTAMTAGAERAFISESAPTELRGTMLGLHSTLSGLALLPASIIAGILWDKIGAFAPFIYGGVMALLAAIVLNLQREKY